MCPEPGHCCRAFNLANKDGPVTVWLDSPELSAADFLGGRRYPFVYLGTYGLQDSGFEDSYKAADGREYAVAKFGCPKVSDEGRCTIYKDRPHLCRDFTPASTALCVFHGLTE